MSGTLDPTPAPAPAPAPLPSPSPAPAPSGNVEQITLGHDQSVTLATLPAADYGDTLVLLTQPAGTVTLAPGTVQQSSSGGAAILTGGTVDYAAPATVQPGQVDTFAYELVSQTGAVVSVTTIDATLDPGPTAGTLNATLGAGQTLDLTQLLPYLAAPGLAGDQLALQSVQVAYGTDGPGAGKVAAVGAAANGDIVVTAPASGSGAITYTVADQLGDTVTGTIDFTVDAGPTVSQQGTYVIGHGQSANILGYVESLVAPGAAGAKVEIAAASDNRGNIVFDSEKGATTGITFTGTNADVTGSGIVDRLTYTAVDTFQSLAATEGTNTRVIEGSSAPVTGTVVLQVDPGPIAGAVSQAVQAASSVDLTAAILKAVTPGLTGDQLTLTAVGTAGTTGMVTLANGDVSYDGTAAGTDSFTYTVADQYGDTAVGTVDLSVSAASTAPTVINGGPYGGVTIQGVDGPEQITAYGYTNTIDANGGSGTIDAGQGNATVNLAGGNLAVTLGGYGNTVSGGDGSDGVAGSLGSTTVALGSGADTVDLGGYNNAVTLGGGNDMVNAGAGSVNVAVGNGRDSIVAGGNQNTIAIGSGTDTILAGAGGDVVTGGGGADTITLGGYGNQVTLDGSTTTLTNGSGGDTISLTGGTANLLLNGSNNAVFLNGTGATIDDQGQGLQITIAGAGHDVIQNAAADPSLVIDLTGGVGGYASAGAALAALTSDAHGGTMLALGAGAAIDFAGAAPSQFTAANFHIG